MSAVASAMDANLNILALANKAWGKAPNQRYRFEQWAPHLERDHRIHIDLLPFESGRLSDLLYDQGRIATKAGLVAYDFLRRVRSVLEATRHDAVLISREASLIGPAIYERLISWMRKPIIFDFDDSIWSPAQAHANGLFSHLHFYGKTSTICGLANVVTVGNDYLARYAAARNGNVHVVPSSIELDEYPPLPEPVVDNPFVVCWTGSSSTLRHLDHARPALEALAAAVPLKVRVICDRPPKPIPGAETEFVKWSAASEARDLGLCHAGIMPLPDDELTRGKCAMKALQYMALGRPAVVSDVGVNAEIVRDGENGFLARSNEEFAAALLRLAKNPALRRRIGANARETVENSYSAQVVAPIFAAAVRSAFLKSSEL